MLLPPFETQITQPTQTTQLTQTTQPSQTTQLTQTTRPTQTTHPGTTQTPKILANKQQQQKQTDQTPGTLFPLDKGVPRHS